MKILLSFNVKCHEKILYLLKPWCHFWTTPDINALFTVLHFQLILLVGSQNQGYF
jgi:hypothetical protein